MSRSQSVTPAPRNAEALADAADLRSVIAAALAARPIDENMLRRGVWSFVVLERDAGASPGQVVVALTDLFNGAQLAPAPLDQARLRQMILWCVEAYFGHLGGDVTGGNSADVMSKPRLVSNR